MPPEVLQYLHDVAQALQLIRTFSRGKTVDEYRNDLQLRSAVERQFITVGEALQQALRQYPELGNQISECRRIVNFRNIMVHGYARIAPDTVWGVIEKDVPILQSEVERLLVADEPS